MNKNQMQGDWEQFKGKAKQKWALLGDKDFELYQRGKIQEFAGKVQEAYGKDEEEVKKEIKEFEESCGCASSDKAA